ncbi:MAG TPA: hypothetical protein VLV16_08740 [Gemmatimonadales bacterium]|nr:hypothetical protein [Gemmatimonadales bacterium]
MTLGRLVLAWLVVAAWFVGAAMVHARLLTSQQPPLRILGWRAGEALVVTLIASLWFDSLGHGGWWLLFLLIGAVAAIASQPATLVTACVDLARYVGAGALLAWRLG